MTANSALLMTMNTKLEAVTDMPVLLEIGADTLPFRFLPGILKRHNGAGGEIEHGSVVACQAAVSEQRRWADRVGGFTARTAQKHQQVVAGSSRPASSAAPFVGETNFAANCKFCRELACGVAVRCLAC